MNKLVEVFKLLNILTKEEINALNNIKNIDLENKDNVYNFYIDLFSPLNFNLFEKIKFVNFNNIQINSKIRSIENITISDISNYLIDYLSAFKEIKYITKIVKNNDFDIDDNIISFNCRFDKEITEFETYKPKIIKVIEEGLAINNVCLKFLIDDKFLHQQKQKEEFKKQLIKDKMDSSAKNEVYHEPKISGKIIPLANLINEQMNVNIHGEIFDIEIQDNAKVTTYRFSITDNESSFLIKYTHFKESNFNSKKTINLSFLDSLKKGDWVCATVDIKTYKYEQDMFGQIKKINKVDKPSKFVRKDDAQNKRIELMNHTKMTAFDAISDVEDIFQTAKEMGHKSVAFTDRYNIQSFPEIQKNSSKFGIKPIYGFETEMIPDVCKSIINENDTNICDNEYVIFDLETTGLYPEFDDIIEFGAIKVKNNAIVDKVQFFIKPKKPISHNTTLLTGITNEMVENAISQEEAIKKIISYISGTVLIAHNAINFDYCFLVKKAEKYLKYEIKNPTIDTLHIIRALFPNWKSHRLQKMCDEFNVSYSQDDAHRADYDANVLYFCWNKIIDLFADKKITKLSDINKLYSKTQISKYNSDFIVVYNKTNNSLKITNELVSISHTDSFFKKPTISRSTIDQKRSSLIIAPNPIEGEVFRCAMNLSDNDLKKAISFYDYIFVMPPCDLLHLYVNNELTLADLEMLTKKIINFANLQNKKVIAVSNSFYTKPWDKKFQYVYLYAKAIGGQHHRYYRTKELPNTFIKTTDEMKQAFAFLNDESLIDDIVVNNCNFFDNEISNDVKPIKDRLYTPKMDDVDNLLKSKVMETAHSMYGNDLPDIIVKRLDKELNSIINNEFSVIYWISHLLVKKSLSDGYVVGSRGSVGSSLVATMLNITDVNPLPPHYVCKKCFHFELENEIDDGFDLPKKMCPKCNNEMIGDGHNIPFETFLGFKCDKVPDIDLNFSGVYQWKAHNFIKEMFGKHHAFRAGTISTIATKTCFGYVKSYFDDIHKFDTTKTELNLYVQKCQDVKRTTGQHPGGILIVPKEYSIFDFSPYNFPADVEGDWYTTHYAFEYLHDNLLKFDILGHDNPTILKKLYDLTGVNEKDIPNHDENVMKLFTSLDPLNIKDSDYNYEKNGAISIPEFGTKFVREMLVDTKPTSFSDLIRISGLSHGTDVYIGNAKSLIKTDGLKLKNVIACRDDILNYLISQGIENSVAFKIMEDVRKGKGLKLEYIEEMTNKNIPKWYIDSCNKIKYIFPKAHATAYVMHAWKFAWYKIYYPLPYYATYFSTKPDVFDIETIVKGKHAIIRKRDDIMTRLNSKTEADSVKKKEIDLLSIFEVVLEMYARGFVIDKPNINLSLAQDFIIKDGKLIAPFSTVDGIGDEVAQSIVDARDKQPFISIDDVSRRTKLNKTNLEILERIGVFDSLPKNDQMKLFDF